MGFDFCVLASGSRGNASLLRPEGADPGGPVTLVDCGLSPRALGERMAPLGVTVEQVSRILLTHLDTDHFHPGWSRVTRDLDIRVHVHERHRRRAVRLGLGGRQLELFREEFTLDFENEMHVTPVLCAHDALGTVGFRIEHDGARLGLATDLGRVPRALAERFDALDALAIESNYDPTLQRTSGRPAFLQRRITSGTGHLSNEQALDAVVEIARRSELAHVVLLHLSRQCNDPALVRGLYTRRAPRLAGRLTIARQDEPTPFMAVRRPTDRGRSRTGSQLVMF